MNAVVIGGGLAGLATALRLRAHGATVTVLEANATFGGKMNRARYGDFTFDTGPSLITMPHVFAGLYSALGESLEDHITFQPVDPVAEYRFPCGARIVRPAGLEAWRETIRQIEPSDVLGFDRIHALGRRLYELSARTFFRRSPYSRPPLSELAALRFLPIRHAWGNYAGTVAAHFRSPYLRRIYNRYATYVGSSPYLCPATLLVIPFLEQEFGAWYVAGGLYSIVESLLRLATARDIALMPSCRVTSIEHHAGHVTGVRTEAGRRLAAGVVVMNGDAATAPQLLGHAQPIEPRSRSLSGLVMLLGSATRPANLPHHTVVFSNDYAVEFHQLCALRRFPEDPTVYISAPPSEPGLFVMANAPATESPWTDAEIAAAAIAVRTRLQAGGVDLSAAETFETWHPGSFQERYLAPFGSIYGGNSHGWRNAFFRPPNRSRHLRGLYFAGGSSHPGGGAPTVLLSAKITADQIAADANR